MKYTEIDHPSHHHPLILKAVEEPYCCDGCCEFGFRPCYQCESCNFHLHEECARAPSSAIHPFFNRCNFIFREAAGPDRRCDGCGKDIKGYAYQCLHKKAYDKVMHTSAIHPCCVKLPHILNGDGIQLRLTKKVSRKCMKCNNKEISRGFNGWSYVSTCDQYCYHVACVKDMVLEKWIKAKFNHQTDGSTSSLALQTTVPSEEMMLVKGESSRSRKVNKNWTIMAKLVLKLIISAIFGDPISGAEAVIESLAVLGG